MEYLIKVSDILILFYACYKLFLNRETFFESNRSFLLIGLATAFVLPLIVIPKYIEVEPIISEGAFAITETQSQSLATSNTIDLNTILINVYLFGVLFLLVRFLVQFSSLVSLYINSSKQRVASYIYVITKKALSPFSFFNWIVFNPKLFNDKELEQIITHEKVHAQQLHSIDILMVEITSIILWFNPFIWLYKKDLRQNLEFIADKNAQASTNCKKSYQHLLLKTSVPNYQLAVTNNFYNSLIKKRIVMLHKNRSNKRNQLKFLLVLPALALFLMSFNTKEVYIKKPLEINTQDLVKNKEQPNQITLSNEPTSMPVEKKVQNNITPKQSVAESKTDIETVIITKEMSDSDLDNLKTKLKDKGITLKIKDLKRNSDNHIIRISVSAESEKAQASMNESNSGGINPIKIIVDGNKISIGNTSHFEGENYFFTVKDGKTKIHEAKKGANVYVYSTDGEDNDSTIMEFKTKNGVTISHGVGKTGKAYVFSNSDNDDNEVIKGEVIQLNTNGKVIVKDGQNVSIATGWAKKGDSINWIKKGNGKDILDEEGNIFIIRENNDKDGKVIIKSTNNLTYTDSDETVDLQTFGKGKGKIFISGDNDKALFIIDDKEVTKKDFENIDTDTVESVNVLKGDSATEKYGDKGKNGVIEVTTKKKKD